MPESLPLWLVAASLSLNVVFLRRLMQKLDTVHGWVCGSPDKPGIADRLRRCEVALNIELVERRNRE